MTQINKRRPISPKQAAATHRRIDDALSPRLFKALSDPTRLRVLACLAKCRRWCSVTEAADCCSVDFSVVSRHLALLAAANVLTSKKEGRTMYYQVNYSSLVESLRVLAGAIEECCPDHCCGGKQGGFAQKRVK